MKALIVEPSRVHRGILEKLFSELDVPTVSEDDPIKALNLLATGKFDLICTSLHLKGMSGLEFCGSARKLDRAELTPILLVTSEEDKGAHKKAFRMGVTEIFLKSRFEEIVNYITYLFQQSVLHRKISGTVLYIEDSKAQANIVKTILKSTGLEVDHYTTAEEGFDAFQNRPFDLVLTDVVLEGDMSGLGLVRAIRRAEQGQVPVPVLAVSGVDSPARRIELLRSGANDYVAKPVLPEELVVRVKNLIMSKQLMDRAEAYQDRLEWMAMTDGLTELYNRHYLHSAAPSKIKNCVVGVKPLSLVVLDLDHFKAINDQHGHAVGDAVLKQVAQLLKSKCREGDVAVRYGGEEFVLLFPSCDAAAAHAKAEWLRQDIMALNPEGLAITASFGVVGLPRSSANCTLEQLFSEADRAMYQAKTQGRNQVVLHEVECL